MRNIIVSLALCVLFLTCFCSCENNKNEESEITMERMKKYNPEYDSERQVIYFKEKMEYDIKGDIAVPLNINSPKHMDFACQLSFYNYGEDIRLFNGCGDDFFIFGIGTINYAFVLKNEDQIIIESKMQNAKYGDWALISISFGNNILKDVFMTPLAMKAYKNGEDDCFIFIQFVGKNKYMNVLFYGGPKECLLIQNFPEVIVTHTEPTFNIDGPINGPGKFWHQFN